MNDLIGETSDGYHTFNELYEHRSLLFINLMRSNPMISWRANNHHDGSGFDGWFVAGIHLPTGDITYHLPSEMWELLDYSGIMTSNRAPEWDGHTSKDVALRLHDWTKQKLARRKEELENCESIPKKR